MGSASEIRAGKAFVEMGLQNSQLIKGLKQSGDKLRDFGKSIAVMGAAMSAGGADLLGPIRDGLKKFVDTGEALYEMSQRTGISAKVLAQLGYAAKQSGTDMEGVETGVRKMQKFMAEAAGGSAEANAELRKLGVSLADLKGLSPDEQFEKLGSKIADIPDPTQKAAAAMKIFGKSGTDLIPLFNNLGAVAEARQLGIGPSETEVRLAHELYTNLGKLTGAFGAITTALGAAVAPMVNGAIPAITRIVVSVKTWVKQNAGLVQTVAAVGAGLAAAGAVLGTLGGLIATVGSGMGKLGLLLKPVSLLFGAIGPLVGIILSPFGLLVGLLGGAAFAFVKFTAAGQAMLQGVLGFLGRFGQTFSTTFGGIKDAVSAGDLALAGSIGIKGLQVAMLQGVAALSGAVGGTLGSVLSKFGAQVAGGDFAGAWKTAVAGMKLAWIEFSTTVKDLWQGAITAIAKGVAFLAHALTEALIDAEALAAASPFGKRDTQWARRDFYVDPKTGKMVAGEYRHGGSAEDRDKRRAEADRDYLGTTAELDKAFAAGVAKRQTEKLADEQMVLDDAGIQPGTNPAADAAARAQDELDALRKKAAEEKQANDAAAAAAAKQDGGAGAVGGIAKDVVGSFSAAAIAAGGAGLSPVVDRLESIKQEAMRQRALAEQTKKIWDQIAKDTAFQ